MVKVVASSELRLACGDGQSVALSEIVPLLMQIKELGSIAGAASCAGLSYRYAWGLIRRVETRLGGKLLSKERGRGSILSELSEKLIWAERIRDERMEAALRGLAGEVGAELSRLLEAVTPVARIRASHGFAVAALLDALDAGGIPIDLKYRESLDAVASLVRGDCDIAGFHLPLGEFRAPCAASYRSLLDDNLHVLIHLTRRTQGLFLPKGNPKGVVGLADLARPDVRFVNRQPGSGTRMLLELCLRKVGVDPDQINGYDSTELTHSAIAAFVASGMADLGFGVEPAANRFGLDFIPVVGEEYFLVCEKSKFRTEPVGTVIDLLRSDRYRDTANLLSGYDAHECGKVLSVAQGIGTA